MEMELHISKIQEVYCLTKYVNYSPWVVAVLVSTV